MKSGFWKKDWFLGLVVSIVLLSLSGSPFVQSLERTAYDWGIVASTRTPSDKLAIIAIDKRSMDSIGPWPWSREVQARMVELLSRAKPKVIAYTEFFPEPADPGGIIEKLLALFPKPANEGEMPSLRDDQRPVYQLLKEADGARSDSRFAKALADAGNVVLPVRLTAGQTLAADAGDFMRANRLQGAALPGGDDQSAAGVPLAAKLGAAAGRIGNLAPLKDEDGVVREESLIVSHEGSLYPSLALSVLARSLNAAAKDVVFSPDDGIRAGNFGVRTDARGRAYLHFYRTAFPEDSFADVLTEKVPAQKFRDKIVLIGVTAPGWSDRYATPVTGSLTPVELEAQVLSNLVEGQSLAAPAWGRWASLGAFVLVAAYLAVLLPRLNVRAGAIASICLLAVLAALHLGSMAGGLVLQFMLVAVLVVIGHLALLAKRAMQPLAPASATRETPASNRMMALALQGQGQLDQAFEYLRRCPLDGTILDNFYNLGLDFERSKQFDKAEAVFRHIAQFNPKFRDLERRLAPPTADAKTIVLGEDSGSRSETPVPQPAQVQQPAQAQKPTQAQPPTQAQQPAPAQTAPAAASGKSMLGRYEVERELGKGAMGVVYLGKDPRIGRVVAIKTMAIATEFEAAEVAEVKERFFREAETAGRLSHPNIVTIFDVGEDRGLCYIAMEVLKGKDLVPFTKPENLLPIEKAVSVCARVADALAYAHKQNIVHRDIKPANIMYEPESDQVKVADFGIARITDSSKTKTGMVLGTPSYMSPEQLSGQKVDGRSDLFSLAVTLYQMLCGKLPFEGKSMAQLMFNITNEPPPDILGLNPSVPPGLVAFLDKAMAKEVAERYQTGEEFAAALRESLTAAGMGAGATSSGVDIDL